MRAKSITRAIELGVATSMPSQSGGNSGESPGPPGRGPRPHAGRGRKTDLLQPANAEGRSA